MREMMLLDLPLGPATLAECLALYRKRLLDEAPPVVPGWRMVAYMTWPNDEVSRENWVTAVGARLLRDDISGKLKKPAAAGISAVADLYVEAKELEAKKIRRRWAPVADLLQYTVDIASDPRLASKGGASQSKAAEIIKDQRNGGVPSKQLAAWAELKDVAHLLAATYWLHANSKAKRSNAYMPGLIAPEAVTSIAAGFQEFGLAEGPKGGKRSHLDPETLWRVPSHLIPRPAPLVTRKLADRSLEVMGQYRARSP